MASIAAPAPTRSATLRVIASAVRRRSASMSISASVAVSASAGKPRMSPTSVWVNWVEPAPMNAIFAIGRSLSARGAWLKVR